MCCCHTAIIWRSWVEIRREVCGKDAICANRPLNLRLAPHHKRCFAAAKAKRTLLERLLLLLRGAVLISLLTFI